MKLRIYFSANWLDSSSPCPWALCDETGIALQSGNSPLAAMPKAEECIAIISCTRLMCVNVQMPAQSRRRWEAALPFVAEEYTLTPPEENHVVPGAMQKQGQRSLFIVDKHWLQSIVSACHAVNIHLRRAVPEMLIPDLPVDTWVIVWDGNKGYMRTGLTSGMALNHGDAQSAPLALRLSLNAALPAPPKQLQIRLIQGETQLDGHGKCAPPFDETCHDRFPHLDSSLRSPLPEGEEANESLREFHVKLPQWPDLPSKLIQGENLDWRTEPIANDTLNLLWGALAPKTRLHEWLPKLQPAALILLAALIIETLGSNIEWGLLNHQKVMLTQAMERTFLKTFGESSVVVNPALQMQRNISALRHTVGLADEADFISLLDQASSALVTLPTGSVTTLHYESGRLDADVVLRNEAELVTLQQRLQSKGLNIRTGEIHNTGKGVETRLAIRAGGAF